MASYLANETIRRLIDSVLSGGLSSPDARDELLSGINLGFVASLPMRGNTLDQIRSDLVELNRVPYLVGGEVPLQVWLENAVHRLRRTFRPEQQIFQEALNEVASQKAAAEPAADGGLRGGTERIVHRDDLLPYGWLRGALAVGTAVARMKVPRFDDGQPARHPGSMRQVEGLGTGWLIGPRHVITNHHVINARSESEPNASEADLLRQVAAMTVQFDYDAEGAAGTPLTGVTLEAWAAWNVAPILDFAILKLPEPSPRTPLTLAVKAVIETGVGVMPVNIVQHPGGAPKMLGVRNNLVSTLTDHAVTYYTDTMQGSSGSPVCNDRWEVVALHRAWEHVHQRLEFQGKVTAWRNVGVRIDRIVAHLEKNHAALWSDIGARVI